MFFKQSQNLNSFGRVSPKTICTKYFEIWPAVFDMATKFMHGMEVHEISNNVVCATSKASDQPAHMHSLIRAFASRLSILWLLSYWLTTIWSFYISLKGGWRGSSESTHVKMPHCWKSHALAKIWKGIIQGPFLWRLSPSGLKDIV